MLTTRTPKHVQIICFRLQADRKHTITSIQLFTGQMPFLPSDNSVKALKAYTGLDLDSLCVLPSMKRHFRDTTSRRN